MFGPNYVNTVEHSGVDQFLAKSNFIFCVIRIILNNSFQSIILISSILRVYNTHYRT
jgi:hypothetical protein